MGPKRVHNINAKGKGARRWPVNTQKDKGDSPCHRIISYHLVLWQFELEVQHQYLQDLKIAQSIARTVETDAETIRIAREDEERAIQDRRMACAFWGTSTTFGAPTPKLYRSRYNQRGPDKICQPKYFYLWREQAEGLGLGRPILI